MSEPRPRIDAPNPPTDLDEERELRTVTALLRSLPAPEPPADLADRVLARIARYEARPRLLRGPFQHAPQRGIATALAAGIGCLLVWNSLGGPATLRSTGEAALVPMPARRVSAAGADEGLLRPRRSVVPWFVSAAVIDGPPADALAPQSIGLGTQAAVVAADSRTNPMDQRLDRQINHLLLDPPSFYQRLDRVRDRDRFVARLAERAARRGDATEIALELRQRAPHYEHTSWLMERMLGAVLVHQGPNR